MKSITIEVAAFDNGNVFSPFLLKAINTDAVFRVAQCDMYILNRDMPDELQVHVIANDSLCFMSEETPAAVVEPEGLVPSGDEPTKSYLLKADGGAYFRSFKRSWDERLGRKSEVDFDFDLSYHYAKVFLSKAEAERAKRILFALDDTRTFELIEI